MLHVSMPVLTVSEQVPLFCRRRVVVRPNGKFGNEQMKLLKKIKKLFSGRVEQDIYRQTLGEVKVQSFSGYKLVSYEKDGQFDYEAYRKVQEAGNKRKLKSVFVLEEVIHGIVDHARSSGVVRRVLCHGTRNAAEQGFFKGAIPGVDVIGTEISETATQFPDTIQWDFHDVKDEWINAFDILYSNSWDHSYDPEKLFKAWSSCVAPGGIMALEHTSRHEPGAVNALDPFGVTLEGLVDLVSVNSTLTKEAILTFEAKRPRRVVIFRKPT